MSRTPLNAWKLGVFFFFVALIDNKSSISSVLENTVNITRENLFPTNDLHMVAMQPARHYSLSRIGNSLATFSTIATTVQIVGLIFQEVLAWLLKRPFNDIIFATSKTHIRGFAFQNGEGRTFQNHTAPLQMVQSGGRVLYSYMTYTLSA